MNDPVSIGPQWVEGNTCLPTSNPNDTCTLDGFPAYVVKATTVRHIQLAVNFARNANIRLVIKNTGHDFLGRSTGGGALSIWTHALKEFSLIPTYTIGRYTGKAARMSAGLQGYDLTAYSSQHGVSIVAPGGQTVGALGGFIASGGHSAYTSYLGLGADQVLSIQVVTADGRFVTADPDQNTDLFYAMRGGGAGTYGVLTSAIVKIYSPVPIASASISFSTTARGALPATSPAAFWRGMRTYFAFVPGMCDDGGQGYNFIRPVPIFNGSAATANVPRNLTFTTSISYPAMSAADARARVSRLVTDLRAAGVSITMPLVVVANGSRPNGTSRVSPPGDLVEQKRMATRLFPRENLADPALLDRTNEVIRAYVEEGGYVFHGINYSPTTERAGWPGADSGVNPAFRRTVMHGEGWEGAESTTPPVEKMVANHARFRRYFQGFIDVSPGAGSYINEADAGEPGWQQAFYGDKYERLVGIKRARDPWSLFLAAVSPGMDEWEVRKPEGYEELPSQNGRLCRVGGA
ncbi:hypothetical protein Daus18300_004857 [Diaporthe australafricana]|uniref:FAD-binding PCMH-type domain-containing protein n=1 Tax=Diaporthe australafricana TaxID=127596 RepID=A0ABR3X5C1_9PEZI